MLVQRTFKKTYAESLADEVRNGYGLERYSLESFPYEEEHVVIIPNLRYPEGLLQKLIPSSEGDFESAIALYEAYPNLIPLQASDRSFWTYLAHADLFSYVKNRFPNIKDKEGYDNQYIWNHWFTFKDWVSRHPLASLWWIVYLTIDEESEDKYKYTKIFFSSYGFRTNFMQYSIARHKEAIFGYFDFLIENPDVTKQWFKPRNRFITKHFNKIGGTRLLSTLPREFFKNELLRIKPQILEITGSSKEDEEEQID